MDVKRSGKEVFVTALDSREMHEVRRSARPNASHAERQRGLIAFLTERGFWIKPDDEVFVWA